jgi:hypothetical protein
MFQEQPVLLPFTINENIFFIAFQIINSIPGQRILCSYDLSGSVVYIKKVNVQA